MNINKLINILSYELMVVKPNIKRRIFQTRELKISNRRKEPHLKILFGINPIWEKVITKAFEQSPYHVFFENYSQENSQFFDFVLPLSIDEIKKLNSYEKSYNNNLIPIPSNNVLEICDDKILFNETLCKQGFGDYLPKIGLNLEYPFLLKKKTSLFGIGSEMIHDKEDKNKFEGLIKNENYFVQEFIEGNKEFAAHILFKNGKILKSLTIKHVHRNDIYIRGHEKEPTLFSEITKCRYLDVFSDILQSINFEGFCCIDYKVAKGKLYILEINPRIGSSCIQYLLGFVNAARNQDEANKFTISKS